MYEYISAYQMHCDKGKILPLLFVVVFLFFSPVCVHFGGERHETRKHLMIFLKRTRKGHHQSVEKRQGEAHTDFSEHTDTILNRTELGDKRMRKKSPCKVYILWTDPKMGSWKSRCTPHWSKSPHAMPLNILGCLSQVFVHKACCRH